jgi:hypothetical protein
VDSEGEIMKEFISTNRPLCSATAVNSKILEYKIIVINKQNIGQ